MKICHDIASVQEARAAFEGTVAFVPTMGYLHDGHLTLLREARRRADHVVLSIYVNPTQFGPGEDLASYPRDLERDAELAIDTGCDLLFVPTDVVMYPTGHRTFVRVEELSEGLCGASRPGHFDGVSTIVTKLFNIIRPDVALFGQKDYQQLAIIRRMTADLNMPIEILGVPTVREADGLAMSSRNKYLSPDERAQGVALSQGLLTAHAAWRAGARDADALLSLVRERVMREPDGEIDYIQIVHPDSLHALRGPIADEDGAVIALAVRFGGARLIDNLRLDTPLPAPLVGVPLASRG